VIGTGFAARAHIEAIRRVPGIEVVAIAGRTAERAVETAAELGVDRGTGDALALVAEPEIDSVHVCTPNDLHAEVTAAAIAGGKHVLSEKPLGFDSRETAALAQQAAGSTVTSGVCFNYRHFPLVQEARTRLASAGPPHLVRGGYLQDWLLVDTDWNWRLDSAKAGSSRAMADIGSHWIDLMQHVTGRNVTRLLARTGRLHEKRRKPDREGATFSGSAGGGELVVVDTEDYADVMLELEGGVPATLSVSQVSPGRRNRLTFDVDTGDRSLTWDQERPNVLRIGRRDRADELLVRDPSLLAPEAATLAHYPAGHQEGWPDGLKNVMIDFYAAVREERQPEIVASFADAHRVMRIVEAVLASNRLGRWVEID
jgi:predicted dehydrogenase